MIFFCESSHNGGWCPAWRRETYYVRAASKADAIRRARYEFGVRHRVWFCARRGRHLGAHATAMQVFKQDELDRATAALQGGSIVRSDRLATLHPVRQDEAA